MSRNSSVFFACAIAAFPAASAFAQENAGLVEELRAVRQMVEQQSKQIDALTRQVAKLAASVEGKAPPKAEGAPAAEPPPPAPPPAAAPGESTPAPKAEIVGPPKHLVAKGETLTSIAKHYNIPLADLLKANKDINDRKLQIGQTIAIPTAPASKAPESPNEKSQ